MDKSVPTLGDILADALERVAQERREFSDKFYPFGGEIEDDGFITAFHSPAIIEAPDIFKDCIGEGC